MFKPISCVQTNVQPGFRRFPNAHNQPLIKPWRCELTALSHACNLYFIACNDTIHIYQPNFPNQSLSEEPDLILHPPVSSPLLEPAIDLTDPHSITRLHIDYLGNEEVLLVTCDDGDVVGYRVPEIYGVIERRRECPDAESGTNLEDQIRIFLHRNVGSSAWGLAVHREARLIAVSANTYAVTVIAYALSSPSENSDGSESPEGFSGNEGDEDFPHPRQRDHVITLQAQSNIPSVSFDNSGDPDGRWLFSSSIDGANYLWDLYSPQAPARILELGHCVSVQDPTTIPDMCRCPGRMSVPHAAWAAMFIDPRSCHQVASLTEACGSGLGPEGPAHIEPCFWDITEFKFRYTARRSGPFPSTFGQGNGQDANADSDSASDMTHSGTEDENENEDSDSEDGTHGSDEIEEYQGGGFQSTEQPHTGLQPPPPPQPDDSLFIPDAIPQVPLSEWLIGSISNDDDDNENEEAEEEQTSDISSEPSDTPEELIQLLQGGETTIFLPPAPEPVRLSTKLPYCELSTSETFQDKPNHSKPCIIITKEEIYLFQRPFDSAGDLSDPILTMRNPLYPPIDALRGGSFPTPAYHRNCYATQIPELGIFIVATPAGRVGIFSLTRVGGGFERPLFGFRMDHLLPSSKVDEENVVIEEVWGRRLVGVAVGPVQGMLDVEDDEGCMDEDADADVCARRWRLMMYYHDHTVYSYELGKGPGVGAPGLGDLVV